LLFVGYRVWPAIAAGAFLLNWLTAMSPGAALALAAAYHGRPGRRRVDRCPGRSSCGWSLGCLPGVLAAGVSCEPVFLDQVVQEQLAGRPADAEQAGRLVSEQRLAGHLLIGFQRSRDELRAVGLEPRHAAWRPATLRATRTRVQDRRRGESFPVCASRIGIVEALLGRLRRRA